MGESSPDGFWDRLAARTRSTGATATIENPRTVMRVATAAAWGSALNAVGTAAFFFFFGEPTAAWATIAVAASYMVGWWWYAVSGDIWRMVLVTTSASMVDIVVIHVLLGGFANSGDYLVWGITQVLVAAMVFPRWVTGSVVAFFATSGVVLWALDPELSSSRPPPDSTLSSLLFLIVLLGNLGLLALILISILNRLAAERSRSERLLLNILPAPVAERLKADEYPIADRSENVTVLFADLVESTPLAEKLDPDRLVELLDRLFSTFDDLVEAFGLEKIATIGDEYMAVAGIPLPIADPVAAAAEAALAMRSALVDFTVDGQGPLQMRFGLHSGPVVAGVIGKRKFRYDLWGDTVNTASRMQSQGEAGKIHVTSVVREALSDKYLFESRGDIDVKGKGRMPTFFLEPSEST